MPREPLADLVVDAIVGALVSFRTFPFMWTFAPLLEKRIVVHSGNAVVFGATSIHPGTENASFVRRTGDGAVVLVRILLIGAYRVHPALEMLTIPISCGHTSTPSAVTGCNR